MRSSLGRALEPESRGGAKARQTRCQVVARDNAHNYTTHVSAERLAEAVGLGVERVRSCVAWRARPLWVIGCSNGCVPAMELAWLLQAGQLVLASGVVSDSQRRRGLVRGFAGKVVLAASRSEHYWGGAARIHDLCWGARRISIHMFSPVHKRNQFGVLGALGNATSGGASQV